MAVEAGPLEAVVVEVVGANPHRRNRFIARL
jgi:hypothetical protein